MSSRRSNGVKVSHGPPFPQIVLVLDSCCSRATALRNSSEQSSEISFPFRVFSRVSRAPFLRQSGD